MKVLIFNTNNPLKASGVVALDLLKSLEKDGHEVRMLINSYGEKYPAGIMNVKTLKHHRLQKIREKATYYYDRLGSRLGLNDPKSSKYSFYKLNESKVDYSTPYLLKKAGFTPDIIVLLWINNFVNSRNIYEMQKSTGARIIWLLYDMAPFTGGCHYAWDCKGYLNKCGNCPALLSSNPYDRSFKNLAYKTEYLGKTDIEVIAGSEWQYRQVISSTLFKDSSITKILIPVDPDIFKPVNRKNLRDKMGIGTGRRVIFFGAMGLESARKGMACLIESLNILKEKVNETYPQLDKEILLLIAGNNFESLKPLLPFDSLYLGNLSNDENLASAYQVSDIFVCPSIEDSGPMMINQSVMCGIPVVSFAVGVAADLVINGQTGYRARLSDSSDMANGIIEILSKNPADYETMSGECRRIAIEYFSPEARMNKLRPLIANLKQNQ